MKILIFGAGKIARGFIGHMLWKGGSEFCFIESNESLAERLKGCKSYQVRIVGKEIQVDEVDGFSTWSYADVEKIVQSISDSVETIFISVGGKNLYSVGSCIKNGLQKRMQVHNYKPINIILCDS